MRNVLLKLTAFFLGAAFSSRLAACPLAGTWDSGFVATQYGASFIRIVHTFDCNGKTTMQAIHARGKMMEAMAEVIERVGDYRVLPATPEAPDLTPVDITVRSVTKRFLDPSSIALLDRNRECAPEGTDLLVPFRTEGRRCAEAVFPGVGFVERVVVRMDGGRMLWSKMHGDDKLVIQKPGEALVRRFVVDPEISFQLLP